MKRGGGGGEKEGGGSSESYSGGGDGERGQGGVSLKKSNGPQRFAHICKTVRKKEERKNLRGFYCKLCEDYYQAHLDEDFDISQVEEQKNKNSKYRGLFKPPFTPWRFWDPDIIEDDEDRA